MDDLEFQVTWKEANAKMRLSEEDDGLKGYVHETRHVLTLSVDKSGDTPVLEETFRNKSLEYDLDAVTTEVVAAMADDGEEDTTDDDASDDEIEEDDNPDYGPEIASAGLADVPTLHAVMVVYGKDICVDSDVRAVRGLLRSLQDHKILNVEETLLHGADATAKGSLAAVKALEPASDDVVLFFYSGHGGMDGLERELCTRGDLLKRAQVVEAVSAKDARLKLVLTDCCAVEMGALPGEEEKLAGAHKRMDPKRLAKLFCEDTGVFDVSSSSNYQYSFGNVFTPILFKRVLLGATPETWQEVFDKTKTMTMSSREGALPDDAKKALEAAGQTVEEHQMPVAFSIPG